MILRTIEHDIAEFINLLESHFARIKQEIHRQMFRLGKEEQERLLRDSLVLAFRDRENFDPAFSAVSAWMSECVQLAMLEDVIPDADEVEFLKALGPTPANARTISNASSSEGDGTASAVPGLDPSQKTGALCPPCWRCRYFDGWLPKRPPKPPTGNYTEMDLICFQIDQRKVEIANYVRDEYPEFLED